MPTADRAAAAAQFARDGYAILRGFLDADELAELRAETDRIYAEGLEHPATWRHGNQLFEILPEPHFERRYVTQAHWMAWRNPHFEALRRNAKFRALLVPLLGPDVKQITQQIHWKPPGAPMTGYRFHQDLKFRAQGDFVEVARSTVTAGLAIDRATRENGCLEVIPGGHRLSYLGLSDDGDGAIMKGLTTEDELRAKGLDPAARVALELAPGDLAIWGLLTVHGSLPNQSERDRAFLIQSYVKAPSTSRGEWAFRDGVSAPLGETPNLCKYDALFEKPNLFYDTREWWR